MSQLHEFQEAMAHYLLAPPNAKAPERLYSMLQQSGFPRDKRLAIYKNNVYDRLINALKDTFPAVHRIVEDKFFRFAAREYVVGHPPRSATLLGYGSNFPDFLAGFRPADSVPYLPDVARLEFLYLESYHARDATPLHLEANATLDGVAQLYLHPSSRLMTSSYPISRIWELNRREEPLENVKIPAAEEFLLVIRPHTQVEVRRLSPGMFAAITAIGEGRGLSDAETEARRIELNVDFASHLRALLRSGTFCNLSEMEKPK